MCDIYNKTKINTGYKVLAYKDDKFYSTFTGQEIKRGIVAKAPEICKKLSDWWNSSIDFYALSSYSFYSNKFDGYTSAFIEINGAKNLAHNINSNLFNNNYSIVIVKIKFIGTIYDGSYQGNSIIAGDSIRSIKIVETLN